MLPAFVQSTCFSWESLIYMMEGKSKKYFTYLFTKISSSLKQFCRECAWQRQMHLVNVSHFRQVKEAKNSILPCTKGDKMQTLWSDRAILASLNEKSIICILCQQYLHNKMKWNKMKQNRTEQNKTEQKTRNRLSKNHE